MFPYYSFFYSVVSVSRYSPVLYYLFLFTINLSFSKIFTFIIISYYVFFLCIYYFSSIIYSNILSIAFSIKKNFKIIIGIVFSMIS